MNRVGAVSGTCRTLTRARQEHGLGLAMSMPHRGSVVHIAGNVVWGSLVERQHSLQAASVRQAQVATLGIQTHIMHETLIRCQVDAVDGMNSKLA